MKKQLFYEELNGDIWTKFDENNQMIIKADQLEEAMKGFEQRIAEGRIINLKIVDIPDVPSEQRANAYATMHFEDLGGTIDQAAIKIINYEEVDENPQAAQELRVASRKHRKEIRAMFPDEKAEYTR